MLSGSLSCTFLGIQRTAQALDSGRNPRLIPRIWVTRGCSARRPPITELRARCYIFPRSTSLDQRRLSDVAPVLCQAQYAVAAVQCWKLHIAMSARVKGARLLRAATPHPARLAVSVISVSFFVRAGSRLEFFHAPLKRRIMSEEIQVLSNGYQYVIGHPYAPSEASAAIVRTPDHRCPLID